LPALAARAVRYDRAMGRTALYRDAQPFRPARAELLLGVDALSVVMPDGRTRRHLLHGATASVADGVVAVRVQLVVAHDARTGAAIEARPERRFVRMLRIERGREAHVIITPPDRGSVAPGVVRLPEPPAHAAIVEEPAWEALADWLVRGGRLAGCSTAELAALATIATPGFAGLIGEVIAGRALDHGAVVAGPLRGHDDVDAVLQPLVEAARSSARAGEALVAAHARLAGARRR
jgi:hypothetical protein